MQEKLEPQGRVNGRTGHPGRDLNQLQLNPPQGISSPITPTRPPGHRAGVPLLPAVLSKKSGIPDLVRDDETKAANGAHTRYGTP